MAKSPVPGAGWNRGSVPDDGPLIPDTDRIMSSMDRDALRHPTPFVTIPARKQTGSEQRKNPVRVAQTELIDQLF